MFCFLVRKRFHSKRSSVPAVHALLIREDVGMGKYAKKQNCNVSRHVSVSRHYFSKSRCRLGLEGPKPRSRLGLGTSKSRKMDKSWPYFSFERYNPQ